MTDSNNPHTEPLPPPDTAQAKNTGQTWLRRFWPLLLSTALSLIWIGICLWWFMESGKTMARMPLYETGGLMAGASLPLILVWLIALVYLRADPLRDQRMALARGLDGLLAPLDVAQRRVNAIVAELHKEIKHVEAAGDIATIRIDNLENRFQEQISNLFEVTTDAEAKAVNIQEILSTEREAFTRQVAELTKYSTELEGRFKQITFDSETLANTARKNSENVSNEITLQNKLLDERSRLIGEQLEIMARELGNMSQEISENCDASENRLENISQTLSEKQTALTETLTGLSRDADQICDKMDKQSTVIAELSQKTSEESTKITATLLAQSTNLSTVAAEALALTTESGEAFQIQADAMSGKLAETRDLITDQTSEFTDKLEETVSSLESQSRRVDEAVRMTTESLSENTGRMNEHYDSFEHLTEQFRSRIDHSEVQLKSRHDDLVKSLSEVAEYLDNSLQNLKEQTGSLGEHAQEIIGSIVEQTEQLSSHIDHIRDQTENTIHNIQEMGETVSHQFTATDEQAAALSENWLRTASLVENQCSDTLSRLDGLTEKLVELEKENSSAALTAQSNVSDVANQLEQASESIFMASASAMEAADETNRAIDEHAEKFQQLINALQLSNKSILIDAEAIEQKNRDKSGNHFSALAARVIEQLQSLSIDINRYFEHDVPDKVWQSYVDGDKNTFIRRLKKVTSRKHTAAIREKYRSDPEFRKYALEYIQIFEDLMSQSMTSKTYSTLSVALISSETGKVYLALAQAMDRFSS